MAKSYIQREGIEYEETKREGIEYEETFSLVAMLKSIRIFLSIAASLNYEIWQIDVKTVFLNRYLRFIVKCQEKNICKLLKSIDRLK